MVWTFCEGGKSALGCDYLCACENKTSKIRRRKVAVFFSWDCNHGRRVEEKLKKFDFWFLLSDTWYFCVGGGAWFCCIFFCLWQKKTFSCLQTSQHRKDFYVVQRINDFLWHVFLSFHCIKCLQVANESEQGEEKLKAEVVQEKISIE